MKWTGAITHNDIAIQFLLSSGLRSNEVAVAKNILLNPTTIIVSIIAIGLSSFLSQELHLLTTAIRVISAVLLFGCFFTYFSVAYLQKMYKQLSKSSTTQETYHLTSATLTISIGQSKQTFTLADVQFYIINNRLFAKIKSSPMATPLATNNVADYRTCVDFIKAHRLPIIRA